MHWAAHGCWDLRALEFWIVLSAEASTPGCMIVVNASLTEHMGPALEVAMAERNQGRSLTKSA